MNKFIKRCWEYIVSYWFIFVIVVAVNGLYLVLTYSFGNIHWQSIFIGNGAAFGLWLAYKRSDALQKQAQADSQQAEIAGKRYASEQFSSGVELLAKDNQKGNPAIGARIGGIYALEKLAGADPKQYGAQVMKTLVAYIRDNAQRTALPVADRENSTKKTTAPEKREEAAHLGEDIKTAFAALKRLYDDQHVWDKSGIDQQELSFAHTDFRALCLNEIEWIEGPDLSSANLTETNLIEAQLNDANLRKAQLNGANLKEAQLHDTDFRFAQLNDADLRKARLNGANLIGAQLHGTDLSSAQLHGANLGAAQLNGADLKFAQLHDANLRDAQLHGADLIGAQLNGANLIGAQLHGANLKRAQLHGADLMLAQLNGANLMLAQLHGADLRDAQLHGADLKRAQLHGANLKRVQAQYTSFEEVWFEGLAGDNLEKLKSALEGRSLSESEATLYC